jgi:hypothetical protein
MLLQPLGNADPKERFHVPSGIGKAMIHAGLAEEYLPPAKPFEPVRWNVVVGALQGLYPPDVRASCPMCGKSQNTESQKGTADQAVFTHCAGLREECPTEVSREYQKHWLNWRKEFQPKLLAKEQREREIAATQRVTYLPTYSRR